MRETSAGREAQTVAGAQRVFLGAEHCDGMPFEHEDEFILPGMVVHQRRDGAGRKLR